MKLMESIALVGSSRFGLSNPFDCSIYAIDCGDGVVLIDAGAGLEPELIEANMRNDGFDPALVKAVVITHTHADHAGGCRWWKDRTGCQIIVPEGERGIVEGTEDISQVLETAKRAGIYPPVGGAPRSCLRSRLHLRYLCAAQTYQNMYTFSSSRLQQHGM